MENENQPSPESPLEGLVDKPMDEMSEDELRAFVMRLGELRNSSQARAAYFRGKAEEKVKPTAFDEF